MRDIDPPASRPRQAEYTEILVRFIQMVISIIIFASQAGQNSVPDVFQSLARLLDPVSDDDKRQVLYFLFEDLFALRFDDDNSLHPIRRTLRQVLYAANARVMARAQGDEVPQPPAKTSPSSGFNLLLAILFTIVSYRMGFSSTWFWAAHSLTQTLISMWFVFLPLWAIDYLRFLKNTYWVPYPLDDVEIMLRMHQFEDTIVQDYQAHPQSRPEIAKLQNCACGKRLGAV
jgi:hypothetical protein